MGGYEWGLCMGISNGDFEWVILSGDFEWGFCMGILYRDL